MSDEATPTKDVSPFTRTWLPTPSDLTAPLRWRKPAIVRVAADLFEPGATFEDADKVFAVMALTPHHTYQVLTAWPDRAAEYLGQVVRPQTVPGDRIGRFSNGYMASREYAVCRLVSEVAGIFADAAAPEGTKRNAGVYSRIIAGYHAGRTHDVWPLLNVWLGVTIHDQATADERIPHLLRCLAAVRFLNIEPLLGAVKLRTGVYQIPNDNRPGYQTRGTTLEGIHWVIVGGGSGPGARPVHPAWVRSLRDQCVEARAPFTFAGWGDYRPFGREYGDTPADALRYCDTDRWRWVDEAGDWEWSFGCEGREAMVRVGNRAAGRLLDGKVWDEMPTVAREVAHA